MNIRFFKHTRQYHKWIGLGCAVFFLVLSVSGVLLMHYEGLGLNGIQVSGNFIPQKYFQIRNSSQTIQALTVGPKKDSPVFIGTPSGLFRSLDQGQTWHESEDGLFNKNIRAIVLDPQDSSLVYAGTMQGIFKSEDGGETWGEWMEAASGLLSPAVNALAIHPDNSEHLLAATDEGLFYSLDQGEDWKQAAGIAGIVTFVTHSKANAKIVYAATPEQNYRSKDGGLKWQPVWNDSIPPAFALRVLATDPEFIYAGTHKGLYKSFNKGQSWIKDNSKGLKKVRSLFVSPRNLSHIYLATDNGLWFTKNGGDSWASIHGNKSSLIKSLSLTRASTLTHIAATAIPSPTLFLGTSDGLIISYDRGNQWQSVDLAATADASIQEERKMDLVKLITEIHTGRFFGSYFFLLVDLATVGLVILVISGIFITVYRQQTKSRKKVSVTEDLDTDRIINIRETASDLSSESQDIHDMVEHISNHLDKCKTIYQSQEKKEVQEIGRHITTLDKKLHTMMARLKEMENFQQN